MKELKVDETFIRKMNQYRKTQKGQGLIEACSNNVVVFAEKMLGLRLYSWQVYFLNQIQATIEKKEDIDNKEFVALTSRQIGKSTAVAVFSDWVSVFNKYPGTLSNNTSTLIASASDVQAKKLLYEMKKLIRQGDRFMERTYVDEDGKPLFGKDFFTDLLDENEPNNTTTITFKPWTEEVHGEFLLKGSLSGSTIKSYPPTSTVLGETASVVIIDEAGKSEKISDQFFYDYLYPTGNSTNAIRIYLSTPWTSSGFFYRMVDPDNFYGESPADAVVFTIDAISIEAPKYHEIVMRTVNQMNSDGKRDEVQRGYYCRFVKGEAAYFNPDKVFECFNDTYSEVTTTADKCDMGVDFGGQTTSKTVITISKLNEEGKIVRLYRRVYEVGKDNNLIEDISNLRTLFNIQRIIPDECPQGDYLIREMKEKGWEIHPMNFRSEKIKKYGAFRSMLNRGEIISFVDDALKTEMLAMEFSKGRRQSIIEHAPGYSDDLIDSFVLSCYFFLVDEGSVKFFELDKVKRSGIMDRIRDAREEKYEARNNF